MQLQSIIRLVFVCSVGVATLLWSDPGHAAGTFKAGFAKADITPTAPTPMWGYGARHDWLSRGVRDPLHAKALVIDTGDAKLALVGLDLGRSPGDPDFTRIALAVEAKAGVTHVMLVGSHTHHGPVLELLDEEGMGKGTFDAAVAYRKELEAKLVDIIVEAAGNTQDARIGWTSEHVDMNRNRHSKIDPKPRDTELSVVRFDDLSGNPIAVMVNFSAHPTTLHTADLRFSAEYPGVMMNTVEAALDTNCFFMQGSSGDMSIKTIAEDAMAGDDRALDRATFSKEQHAHLMTLGKRSAEEITEIQASFIRDEARMVNYGKRLGVKVIELAKEITTAVPEKPSIKGQYQDFNFVSRVNFESKFVQGMFRQAFFKELADASIGDVADNVIKTKLTVVLLNDELAMVGGSGEFFSSHANRLKERSGAKKTLFFGYCNGHNMYFPTIEGVSQGGYGADPEVSWVAVGAGETMMNEALIVLYEYLGKISRKQLGGV
ncbi:MAG: hypothetical protein VCD00_06115 [Candidatus Hydrogenedentota bacterium]